MGLEHWFYTLPLRLRSLFRRSRVEDELDEELRYHLDRQIEVGIARGLTPQEARDAALRAMGGFQHRKDECRDARRMGFIEDLLMDIRIGLRMLVKRPFFATVAVLTVAIGIGANTAIFSVVNAVLLRPLPYKDSERIVKLWNTYPPKGIKQLPFSEPEFLEFRNVSQSFDHVGAYMSYTQTLTGAGEPQRIPTTWASADLFAVLGVQPLLGRTFSAEEDLPGGARVVLLGYRLWQSHFGADSTIVGKEISLQGASHTVVGVMPGSFTFPTDDIQLWMPLRVQPASTNIGAHFLRLVAHIRPGTTLEQARVEAQLISDRIVQKYPQYFSEVQLIVTVSSLHEETVGDVRLALLVLLGGVGFMLLIACTNVANLLLARATARAKEIAMRTALGASRLRIVRQLLAESLLLFGLGGALGLLLAMWGVRVLIANSPVDLPRASEVAIDGWVLAFTALTSILTGVFFGLAPALQTSKTDLNMALKDGSRSATEGKGRIRLRNGLVVGQVALSIVLLAGAGLMIRSFMRLQEVRLGFDPENVLTMALDLPSSKYTQGRQVTDFYRQLIERVRALPGVETAAVAHQPAPSAERSDSSFEAEGRQLERGTDLADCDVVSSEYFRALNVPLLQGRYFIDADSETPAAVIVNQTMARLVWSGDDPLGKRIRTNADSPWLTVVGVVTDVKNRGPQAETRPEMFFPYTEKPFGLGGAPPSMTLLLRTTSDPHSLVSAVKSELRALDSELPVYKVQSMKQIVSASVSQMRFTTMLLSGFAGISLLLAAVGVYGVMSYSVVQRTHEIGVRKALGAQSSDIFRLFAGQAFALSLLGVGLGLIVALFATELMSKLLYDVSTTDSMTFMSIAMLLLATALLASYLPARRAMKTDPVTALRYE